MRFNDRITFIKLGESYYDPDQGRYVESNPVNTIKPCDISSVGIERSKELFGEIDTNVIVVRLQHPYTDSFDQIEINNTPYQMQRQSNYRKGVFYLRGGNNG
ncbi:hypothetical protein [Paraliobacillus ryukyuensis]|uniref:hypothetical protein n=1 Tax=Paraliobacillus ryukyuensis TaxID=200904 RepID=UPI0009A8FDB5|nr:hypothetical protein [Paraliobacillus ryukyuensis]